MTNIDNSTKQIIKHARKSLLLDNTGVWVKNDKNPLFGLKMGSSDSPQESEIVCFYLLIIIAALIDSDSVGLYRDDGLAVIHNANGPKLDKLRKNIIAAFKNELLSITFETNLAKADFLDVTFNLSAGKYYPYNKPNNAPL